MRFASLLIPLCALFCMLLGASASAQYMFMDTNGDSVHTSADVMSPNGTQTSADIYVITNQNRNGSTAVCNNGLGTNLTIYGYVVNLVASGGSVNYSGFTNAMPSFTIVAQPLLSDSTEFTVGYASGTPLDPGKYKLGTVTLTANTGAVALNFAPMTSLGPYPNAFGTDCPGTDFDNIYKLAVDWNDADGLGTAMFRQPIVTAPSFVTGSVGSPVTFAVIAMDPDGDPIESLTAEPLPVGASIETSLGNLAAIFTWTPSASQIGRTTITFTASNELSGSATVTIEILPADRSPVVTAPVLVSGAEGSPVTFTVSATDPDEDHIEFLDVAPLPPGASFEVGASNASGTFDWTPSLTQAGVYYLTVTARSTCRSDSGGTVCATGTAPVILEIADTGGNPTPPVVTAPSDVLVEELGTLSVTVTASDPDGGTIASLTADLSGLPATNDPTFTTNPTHTEGQLVWQTSSGNAGTYAVTFMAVDNDDDLSGTATTSITVIPVGATVVGEVKWTPAVPDTGTFTITFTAIDAESIATTATTDVTVTGGSSARRTIVTRAPSALMEPQRGPIISVSSSATIPTGEKWTLTVSVTPDETPPQGMAGSILSDAMEPTRGPIISLTADLSRLPTTNPATFTTNFDPQVSAPATVEGQPGTAITFQVNAADPDGEAIDSLYAEPELPAGSVWDFITTPDHTQGTFSWVPQLGDARDLPYSVVFTATNTLVASATTLITVRAGNRAPVADAGGPYSGLVNVPVSFDGTASSDPDGDALQYSWSFGDGLGASGGTTSHTYALPGNYVATLTVTDVRPQGSLVGIDSASVHIDASLGALAFATGGDRVVRLRAAKPTVCVQLEPVGTAFVIADVDLSSIVLRSPGTGSVSEIAAVPGKKDPKDLDGNGVLEISVCFDKDALRQLFSEVSGRTLIQTVIAGRLKSGAPFQASVTLDVIGASGALTATLAPNPFNPTAVLSFELPQAGRVRLHIFDLAGRLVREAIRGDYLGAGFHDVPIDGRDGNGRRMASGVYFYRLETPSGNATGRIVLMQ